VVAWWAHQQYRLLRVTIEALKGEYGTDGKAALLTANGRVLLAVLEHPYADLTELAEMLGITMTRISKILSILVEDDVLVRQRVGHHNEYIPNHSLSQIHSDTRLLRRLTDLVPEQTLPAEECTQP
jgi:transcription initiation factor IIE alpha subunit